MFTIYACVCVCVYNVYTSGDLMEYAKVSDNNSQNCRQADMDTIFKATNFELKGSDPNDDNPLEVLKLTI
jgi:hypothetical protein